MSTSKRPTKDLFGFQEKTNQNFYRWLAIPFFLFCLTALPKINIEGWLCRPGPTTPGAQAGPGECYYYLNFPRHSWGIFLHLASVLPSGLLAVLQFTPAIRKYRRFHRFSGYVSTILAFVGTASSFLILDTAFGGRMETIMVAICMALMSTYALTKGVLEARAKRFAGHRDWMLRAWMYLGTILSMRLMMPFLAAFSSFIPAIRQHAVMPCEVILDILQNDTTTTYANYPMCKPEILAQGLNPTNRAVVAANLAGGDVEMMAAMHASFGTALWISLLLHTVGLELYLRRAKSAAPKQVNIERKEPSKTGSSIGVAEKAINSAIAEQGALPPLKELTSLTR